MFIGNSDWLHLFLPFLIHVYSCANTFDVSLFVYFAIFLTISKVKEKGCFGRTLCNFKSFLNWRFIYLISLKSNCSIFKSTTQIQKSLFQLMDTVFHWLSSFSRFSSQSNPYKKHLILILRKTSLQNRFHISFVTSPKSTTRLHEYNSF